jgi:plasmid maintenance system antidote protein VapI
MKEQIRAWPVGDYINDELVARNWTIGDLARRMSGDTEQNILSVELLLAVNDPNLYLGLEMADQLARVFDVSPDFLLNLDKAYRTGGN